MFRHFTGFAASSRGLLASFSACCAAWLLLSCAPQPAFAQFSDPGGVDETAVALPFEPGSTYPWQNSTQSGTNMGNGNKLTTIPLVGWSGKGGLPVSLSLFHNSQGQGVSELGPKWTHSFDIYLVLDPATDRATVH